MGLTTAQFLEMDIWQFNAYSLAWKARTRDSLAIAFQGAWMTAYWSSNRKHKMSLKKALKSLEDKKDKETERKPIDKQKVEKAFKRFEEIQKYGWTKV